MRGQHYPRQNRMEETARMRAEGKKRTRRQPTEREMAYDAALKSYFAARKEAEANGTKLPSMADYVPVFN